MSVLTLTTLQYITSHCITAVNIHADVRLDQIRLHYTTLHYITLHTHITLQYVSLHYMTYRHAYIHAHIDEDFRRYIDTKMHRCIHALHKYNKHIRYNTIHYTTLHETTPDYTIIT